MATIETEARRRQPATTTEATDDTPAEDAPDGGGASASRQTLINRVALGVVVAAAAVLAVALHRNGHARGDDFALYLRQAPQLVRRQHRRGRRRQPFRGPQLDRRLQPVRVSVGTPPVAVSVRAPVGPRLRPLEARRSGGVLRLARPHPRHRPPARRSCPRPRGHRRSGDRTGVPQPHRPTAVGVPARGRRRRGDLVARPDADARSPGRRCRPRPGGARRPRDGRLQLPTRRNRADRRHRRGAARRARRVLPGRALPSPAVAQPRHPIRRLRRFGCRISTAPPVDAVPRQRRQRRIHRRPIRWLSARAHPADRPRLTPGDRRAHHRPRGRRCRHRDPQTARARWSTRRRHRAVRRSRSARTSG